MGKNCFRLINMTRSSKPTGQIARRVFLERAAGLVVAAGVASGGLQHAKASDKADKDSVSYQATPNDGRDCAGCQFFDGENSCEVVAGEISASGWCAAWSAA